MKHYREGRTEKYFGLLIPKLIYFNDRRFDLKSGDVFFRIILPARNDIGKRLLVLLMVLQLGLRSSAPNWTNCILSFT